MNYAMMIALGEQKVKMKFEIIDVGAGLQQYQERDRMK